MKYFKLFRNMLHKEERYVTQKINRKIINLKTHLRRA